MKNEWIIKFKKKNIKVNPKRTCFACLILGLFIMGGLGLNYSLSHADTAWVSSYPLNKDDLIRDLDYDGDGTDEYNKGDIKYVWDISASHDGSILAYYFKDDNDLSKYAGGTLMFYNTDTTNENNFVMPMKGFFRTYDVYHGENNYERVVSFESKGNSGFNGNDFSDDSFYSGIVNFRGYNKDKYNDATPWSAMNQLSENDRIHEVHFFNTLYFNEAKWFLSGFEDCFIDIKNMNFDYIYDEIASITASYDNYDDDLIEQIGGYFYNNLVNLNNCTIKFTGDYGFMCRFSNNPASGGYYSKNNTLDLSEATFTCTDVEKLYHVYPKWNSQTTNPGYYMPFVQDSINKIYLPQELNNFDAITIITAFNETPQIYEVYDASDSLLGYTYKMIDKTCTDYSGVPCYLVPRFDLMWQALFLTMNDSDYQNELKKVIALQNELDVSDITDEIFQTKLINHMMDYAYIMIDYDSVDDETGLGYFPLYDFIEKLPKDIVREDSIASEFNDSRTLLISDIGIIHGSGMPMFHSLNDFFKDIYKYINLKLEDDNTFNFVISGANTKTSIENKLNLIKKYANDYYKIVMTPELVVNKNETVTYLDEIEIDITNAQDSFFEKYFTGKKTKREPAETVNIADKEEVEVEVRTSGEGTTYLRDYKEVGDYFVFDSSNNLGFLTTAGDIDIPIYCLGNLTISSYAGSFVGDKPNTSLPDGLSLDDFSSNEDVTTKLTEYKLHIIDASTPGSDIRGYAIFGSGDYICAVPKKCGKTFAYNIIESNKFNILADMTGEVTYEFHSKITTNTLYDVFKPSSTVINVQKLDLSVNNNKVQVELLSDKADGDLDKVKVKAKNNKGTILTLEKDKDYEVTWESEKGVYKISGIGSSSGSRFSDEIPNEDPAPTPGPTPGPSPGPTPSPSPQDGTKIVVSAGNTIAGKKIINGYLDGTFKPNQPITRAEVSKMISVLNGYQDSQEKTYISQSKAFKDLAKVDWYSPYIGQLLTINAVEGDGGLFRPNNYMTRAEVCKLITNIYFIKDNGINVNKVANELKGQWFESCVSKLYKSGYLVGYPNGKLEPNGKITRAEFVTLLNRVLNKNKTNTETFGTEVNFKDVKRTDWFYNDLLVALSY